LEGFRGRLLFSPQKTYFLTLLACLTRFSITPSKASFSFRSPSLCLSQYSNSSEVFSVKSCSSLTCFLSSSSVNPSNFSSVVAQRRFTAIKSNSGAGGGPFGRLDRRSLVVPDCVLSTEPVESFASCAFNRATEPSVLSDSEFRDEGSRLISGRTSFFCFDGGSISSRSTGTPRLTRNRRRIRDWVQLGGWRGGGVINCFQSERDLSEGKIGEESGTGSCEGIDDSLSSVDEGNMASKCAFVAARSSGTEECLSKSKRGCRWV